jgi:hypothetical protein
MKWSQLWRSIPGGRVEQGGVVRALLVHSRASRRPCFAAHGRKTGGARITNAGAGFPLVCFLRRSAHRTIAFNRKNTQSRIRKPQVTGSSPVVGSKHVASVCEGTWLTPPARGSSAPTTNGRPPALDNAGRRPAVKGLDQEPGPFRCTPAPAAQGSSPRLLRRDSSRRDQDRETGRVANQGQGRSVTSRILIAWRTGFRNTSEDR